MNIKSPLLYAISNQIRQFNYPGDYPTLTLGFPNLRSEYVSTAYSLEHNYLTLVTASLTYPIVGVSHPDFTLIQSVVYLFLGYKSLVIRSGGC